MSELTQLSPPLSCPAPALAMTVASPALSSNELTKHGTSFFLRQNHSQPQNSKHAEVTDSSSARLQSALEEPGWRESDLVESKAGTQASKFLDASESSSVEVFPLGWERLKMATNSLLFLTLKGRV